MSSGQGRLLLLYVLMGLASTCTCQTTPAPAGSADWTLTWSDEFSGPNGSAVDRSKWVPEIGGKGWGNHELEYYTDRSLNASVHDGNLVITAVAEKYHRRRRGHTKLHLGAPQDPRTIFANLRPLRSSHQNSLRSGHLACPLDARR
jgi:hypothetical protein